MLKSFKTLLKDTNFHILHEISNESIYQVAHPFFKQSLLYISVVDTKILLSVTVGELVQTQHYMPKQYTSSYFSSFINCIKNSFSQKYRPLEAMEKSLVYEPINTKDFTFKEHITLSLFFTELFDIKYHLLEEKKVLLLNVQRVDKYLIFNFKCDIENLEDKLIGINQYLQAHKEDIEILIH